MYVANSVPPIFCDSSHSKFKISGLFTVPYVLPGNVFPRLSQPFLAYEGFSTMSVCAGSTTNMDDHHLSVIREYLFKIFPATLRVWRPFSVSATWWCATSFLRGITFQLLCKFFRLKHNFFIFKYCITSYVDFF